MTPLTTALVAGCVFILLNIVTGLSVFVAALLAMVITAVIVTFAR